MKGDLTFLSLMHGNKIPPTRNNAERLRMMRARLTPYVGNGTFNFGGGKHFKWQIARMPDAIWHHVAMAINASPEDHRPR